MAATVSPPPAQTPEQVVTDAPLSAVGGRWALLRITLRKWLGAGGLTGAQRAMIAVITCSSLSMLVLIYYVADRRLNPPPGPELPKITINDALQSLQAGSHRQALSLLDELQRYVLLRATDQGGADLIRGVLMAQDAERMWDQDQARMARQALRYLHSAKQRGVSEEYRALLLYWLCQMQVQAGQAHLARAWLQEALERNPERQADLQWLAALAWQAEPHPDLERALEFNSAYLAHETLETTPRQEGILLRARLLFGLGRDEESRTLLRTLRPDTNTIIDGMLLEAELTIHQAKHATAEQAPELYRQAIEILNKTTQRGVGREQVQRQASFWTGVCQRELGDDAAAYETFQKTRRISPQSPEGLTAAIYAAQLAPKLNLSDELTSLLMETIQAAGDVDSYYNPLCSWESFRDEMQRHYRDLYAAAAYEQAVELALVGEKLFGVDTARESAAQARIAQAQLLTAEAEMPQADDVPGLQRRAAELYRSAGEDYAALANARFTSPDYLEQIWRSAEYSLLGRDYAAAAERLELYLQNEVRARRSLALLRLGESKLMLGKPVDALTVLEECITLFPRDAASFRARVLAARALEESAQRERAKALYLMNLESGQLTPASSEWRDSLFALGKLYFHEARELEIKAPAPENPAILSESEQQAQQLYQESINRLEEAVERYPNAEKVIDSRYLIAEAYRRLAAYPRRRLSVSTIRNARDEYTKDLRRLLSSSMVQDTAIQQDLGNRRENQELTAAEHTLLRNSFFTQGASLYELERYREAAGVYLTMINRYQTEPQVLDAYTQLVKCYRRLGQREEARAALEQARSALSRLQADPQEFTNTTNHDPAEWQAIMDWLDRQ